jgi:hypothetical protein
MQQAMGWLRWTPDAFWGATLADVHSGLTGFLETRGVAPPDAKREAYDEMLAVAREAKREERRAARATTT